MEKGEAFEMGSGWMSARALPWGVGLVRHVAKLFVSSEGDEPEGGKTTEAQLVWYPTASICR